MWTLGCMKATPISGKGLLSHMMLLKLGLGLGLLTGVSSSEAANPACNLCWHFWFRSCVLQPWIFLVAAASTPRLLRGKDRPGTSCAPTPLPKDFKSKTLDQGQACCLLPEANQDRGFAKPSCSVLLPALSPPPRRCLSTVVSRWDPSVLDERPGELNHPWSGVFCQALLQP